MSLTFGIPNVKLVTAGVPGYLWLDIAEFGRSQKDYRRNQIQETAVHAPRLSRLTERTDQRLSEELRPPSLNGSSSERAVHLSEKDVADAVRLLMLITSATEHQPIGREVETEGEMLPASQGDGLVARARRILRLRKLRSDFFVSALFSEWAWDMLLTLYCDDAFGPRHSVTGLCVTVRAPVTSALRWLAYLESKGLVTKIDHPTDKRSSLIKLTGAGRASMERYLQAVHEQAL